MTDGTGVAAGGPPREVHDPPDAPVPSRLPLWRTGRFVRAWGAQGVSELGDRVSELALPLVAVTFLDASATEVALLTAVVWLPNVLALLVGSWVDRQHRKRRLLVLADVVRAAVVVTVPVAALLGVLGLAHLFAVAVLLGAWSTFFRSAWNPFFVALVHRSQYVEATSLFSATRSGSFVAGPAVGGGLVQLLTAPVALLVDGLSFLASALLLRTVDVTEPAPDPDDGTSLRRRLAEGVGFLLRDPYLAPLLRCVTWVNFFTMVVFSLTVVFASRDLGLPAGTIGLAMGVGAVGGLVGAAVTSRTITRLGVGRTLAVGALLFTAPLAAMPLAQGGQLGKAVVLGAVECVSAFGVMLFDIPANAVKTVVIPDAVRARVSGAFTTVNYGVRPLGAASGGLLAGLVGTGPAIVVGGLGGVLCLVWIVRSPVLRLRTIEDLPVPAAPPRRLRRP
ncbi:MFS transporter [Phycicoccus flavus]|uniref:MFS transporter n=1 Tax=Phycicoccus flavus TaxID=2502783 RepID=UPI000FEBAD88|nr:MFS transporter [Phycicoccus flavus]NHA66962.1 MFS transporter [Phycicoccus flavus]